MTSPLSSASHLPPIPPSPTQSYASSAFPAASVNAPPPPPFPKYFLSQADISASTVAYEHLSEAAKAYRKALSTVASAASAFGAALETCARCKGAGDTADGLMGTGGLQYLIASNMHILSESLYRGFEVALLHEVDSYKEKISENEERYRKQAAEMTRDLRRREQQHLKLSRQKTRNLAAFRSALVDLTEQVDALESLKYSHYRTAHDLSKEASTRVLDMSALVVRAEVEVFEKIAQKGWDSSGGLEDLIARSPDPFALQTGGGDTEREIFSILPSESILPGGALSRSGSTSAASGLDGAEGKYQSLSGALSYTQEYDETGDALSVFSGGLSTWKGKSSSVCATDQAFEASWEDEGDAAEHSEEASTVRDLQTSITDPGQLDHLHV